jgi:hypothetical protein
LTRFLDANRFPLRLKTLWGMIPKSMSSGLTRGWKPVFGKDHAQTKR